MKSQDTFHATQIGPGGENVTDRYHGALVDRVTFEKLAFVPLQSKLAAGQPEMKAQS
jgi:hypothetical protein